MKKIMLLTWMGLVCLLTANTQLDAQNAISASRGNNGIIATSKPESKPDDAKSNASVSRKRSPASRETSRNDEKAQAREKQSGSQSGPTVQGNTARSFPKNGQDTYRKGDQNGRADHQGKGRRGENAQHKKDGKHSGEKQGKHNRKGNGKKHACDHPGQHKGLHKNKH
ncbi:MAG TPA: hypothetical protein PKE06_13675 [Flavilitoribacter sp.]|nr:hypothetical protein [Flavilitoribacter sp.]HMQ88871.1 hypothetical protein [Flavilitoribacter sp.]